VWGIAQLEALGDFGTDEPVSTRGAAGRGEVFLLLWRAMR
jgi:hypothetical protein